MRKIVSAETLPGYQLRLRYDDGVEGVVDLSAEVGRGVFAIWTSLEAFARFRIERGRRIVWSDDVDLCADALYLEVTGQRPEDLFPRLKGEVAHA